MPTNNTGSKLRELCGRFPGAFGHLFSPGGQRKTWLPYALDNGAYSAFSKGIPFDALAYRKLLEWTLPQPVKPIWALVPDCVGNREETMRMWHQYKPMVRGFGIPLAFAVQDGMGMADVPSDASVVFVGGSTQWKRDTAPLWCRAFPRVHIGRVNTYRWLRYYEDCGAESCDGTGWFRGCKRQLDGLVAWLEERNGLRTRFLQANLFSSDDLDLWETPGWDRKS